jgi:hypothetical protein
VKNILNVFGNCTIDKPWENIPTSFGHGTTNEHEIYVRGPSFAKEIE